MKRTSIVIAAALLAGSAALAQPGPGMRGGYGPGMGGYGPGMGGYGPGMMGGYGPGMMGRWNGYAIADLSPDQRKRIQEAQQEFWKKQWPLMQQMHTVMWNAEGKDTGGFDEQAARKEYESVAALHKQMFENMIEMRRKADAVLTPKQREELRRDAR